MPPWKGLDFSVLRRASRAEIDPGSRTGCAGVLVLKIRLSEPI